jgi:hypothetical protein
MVIINDLMMPSGPPTSAVLSFRRLAVNAVLVGADRLGNIPQVLSRFGIAIKHHVSGRDPAHQKKGLSLPSGTDVVIMFTDFLGHNVMRSYRDAAQRLGVRVVACRRSACAVQQSLEGCGYRCGQCMA